MTAASPSNNIDVAIDKTVASPSNGIDNAIEKTIQLAKEMREKQQSQPVKQNKEPIIRDGFIKGTLVDDWALRIVGIAGAVLVIAFTSLVIERFAGIKNYTPIRVAIPQIALFIYMARRSHPFRGLNWFEWFAAFSISATTFVHLWQVLAISSVLVDKFSSAIYYTQVRVWVPLVALVVSMTLRSHPFRGLNWFEWFAAFSISATASGYLWKTLVSVIGVR